MSNVQLEYSANDMAHLCNEAKGNFEVLATLIEQAIKEISANQDYLLGIGISISLKTSLHLALAAQRVAESEAIKYGSNADDYMGDEPHA